MSRSACLIGLLAWVMALVVLPAHGAEWDDFASTSPEDDLPDWVAGSFIPTSSSVVNGSSNCSHDGSSDSNSSSVSGNGTSANNSYSESDGVQLANNLPVVVTVDGNSDNSTAILVGLFLGIPLVVGVAVALIFWCLKRRKKKGAPPTEGARLEEGNRTGQGPDSEPFSTIRSGNAAARRNRHVVGWVDAAEPPLGTTSNRAGAGALVATGSMAFDEDQNVAEREMIRAGEFRRIKLVGRGSFGSVYSVLLDNGRTIAMKEIMLSQESFQQQVEDVEREMAVMREVHHENVVQYYTAECDAIEYKLQVFMEYVTGGSLGFMARQTEEALTEASVKGLVAQALRGLVHIHGQGIVHRDIKGDNMLLSGEGHVKLADFGTARSVQGTSRGAQTMIGTPYFMAPELLVEQDTGEIEYGMKADVWSMGITVCELLDRGLPPWPAFNNPGQAFLHIAGNNLPIVPKGCSELAEAFILKACTRSAKERPTSAELLSHEWLRDAWVVDDGNSSNNHNTSQTASLSSAHPNVNRDSGSSTASTDTAGGANTP